MTAQLLALVLCVAADAARHRGGLSHAVPRRLSRGWPIVATKVIASSSSPTGNRPKSCGVNCAEWPRAARFITCCWSAMQNPAQDNDRAVRERCVPTHHARAVVNVKFGSEPEIASDNWYADLDDDRLPDVAIGRLTPDSPADFAEMVQKILAYERSADFGPWRRQIQFIAGLGGFGPLADAVLESSAKSLIGSGVPAPYTTTMTYGSWQSPYCPDPREFRQVTIDRLNEGSLFWVYIGHGQQRARSMKCMCPERSSRFSPLPTFRNSPASTGRRSLAFWPVTAARSISRAIAWPKSCCANPVARSPCCAVRA